MSNNIDLTPDTDSRTAPGLDHPTTTVDVTFPDGEVERVDPDYEIITACNAREELGCEFDETRTSRVEFSESHVDGEFDRYAIRQTLCHAWGSFAAAHGFPEEAEDVCVEMAYFRDVEGIRTLCVQLRGQIDKRALLSQFALHVDECLREQLDR